VPLCLGDYFGYLVSCTMAGVPTKIDPLGLESHAILQTTRFANARILEMGAGDGRVTFQYADKASYSVGIDTNEPEIHAAAMRAHAEGDHHVQFLCASATALPFAAEEFEIVLLASSL